MTTLERFTTASNLIAYLQRDDCPAALKQLHPILSKYIDVDFEPENFASPNLDASGNGETNEDRGILQDIVSIPWGKARPLDEDLKTPFLKLLGPTDAGRLHPREPLAFMKDSITIRGNRFARHSSMPKNSLAYIANGSGANSPRVGLIQHIFSVKFRAGDKSLLDRSFLAIYEHKPYPRTDAPYDFFSKFSNFGASLWSMEKRENPTIIDVEAAVVWPCMQFRWGDDAVVVKPIEKVCSDFLKAGTLLTEKIESERRHVTRWQHRLSIVACTHSETVVVKMWHPVLQ